jgi:hypothetical protein
MISSAKEIIRITYWKNQKRKEIKIYSFVKIFENFVSKYDKKHLAWTIFF